MKKQIHHQRMNQDYPIGVNKNKNKKRVRIEFINHDDNKLSTQFQCAQGRHSSLSLRLYFSWSGYLPCPYEHLYFVGTCLQKINNLVL